jgi:hypothetical protein
MRRFLLSILLFFPLVSALALEFYVSPRGSDQNEGTIYNPFATLEGARDAIRKAKNSKPISFFDAITVYLRQGIYSIETSFVLEARDSGNPDGRITYRNYPGEPVHLIGGRVIPADAISQVRDASILDQLNDPDAREHLYVIDLGKLGIDNFGKHRKFGHALPVVPAPLELFINGEVMPLARYPNQGAMQTGKVLDTGSIPRIRDYENIRGGIFKYTDDRHSLWVDEEDLWLRGTFKWGYADDKIKVEWIDPQSKRIKLSSPHMYGLGSGEPFQQYVALNLLQELDMPGEWYLNRSTGKLYFWPPNGAKDNEILVSIIKAPIIALQDVSFVTLQGIIIEASRGMGIYMQGGEENLISDCVIRNIGTVGIQMGQGAEQTFPHITHDDYDGRPVSGKTGSLKAHLYKYTTWDRKAGKNHGISGCHIYNTGSGGIVLSGGNKEKLVAGNNYVRNCRVHDYQRRNRSQWAGISVDGCGNRIDHCEIYNGDLQAIMVNGPLHAFEYNHIHHVGLNANDASAWYMGRDPSDQGTIIRYNFFHHVGRHDRKWMMGVYFDDGTCGALVEGNIFYNVGTYGSIYSNGGQDIIIRNNIFIKSKGPAVQQKSMWWDFAAHNWDYYFADDGVYRRRLLELIDIRKPPYSIRFPHLASWMDQCEDGKTFVGMYPARNVLEKNVFYQCEQPLRLTGLNPQFDCRKNYIAIEDPGFHNLDSLDLRLVEGSVVYKEIPDFIPIPFEKIGLEDKSMGN